MNHPSHLQIADSEDVETLLDEMADAIAPHLSESTALVGILRRGAPLAEALADRLEDRTGRRPEVGKLKLKRYSDELELLHDRPELDEDTLDIDIEDRHLVLVDDVLFTGESMLRAAGWLRAAGATKLQTAFLCVRAGRTMPVHADFVGATLEVRPDWVIHCAVPPYEEALGISVARTDD
ncbi:MAG: phosphoribosyltransferase family protein [Wenzhouxiangellaceae bacterium]|nr:phosphoribosyltransferase family protein [Wenzhouxiangellaceae bacterium]